MYYTLILFSAAIALVAVTYSVILTEPGMLLNGLYNWLHLKLNDVRSSPITRVSYPTIKAPGIYAPWLFNPLIGCYKCVAGQLALWLYFWHYWSSYSLLQHVFFICFAIYISTILNKIHTWTQHNP